MAGRASADVRPRGRRAAPAAVLRRWGAAAARRAGGGGGVRVAREPGEPFRTAGLCYYRDGRDSVAWHGDTIGRGRTEDTMVAILSLGEARPLLLRPRGGGE